MRQIDLGRRVRIRIDAHHATQVEGPAVPAPIEIEPPGVRVDLDRHMMFGAGPKNSFDVYFIARAAQKLAARHVTKDRHERIGHCAQYALGLFLLVLPELSMDASHDEVEVAEDLVRIVE